MNKKLVALILGLGALIALGLGVFLSFKTKDIKSHIEKTLNEKFESFAQESGYIAEWEPFSCSGLVSIGCYSPKIVATDGEGVLTLKNMGFDIDSIDNTSLQASLNIKDIVFEVKDIDADDKDSKENLALFSSFFPNNVKCAISLKQNDDKLTERYLTAPLLPRMQPTKYKALILISTRASKHKISLRFCKISILMRLSMRRVPCILKNTNMPLTMLHLSLKTMALARIYISIMSYKAMLKGCLLAKRDLSKVPKM